MSQLVPVAIPAPDFVAEKVGEDGIPTVLPLAGWLVSPEGEIRPLPSSLDASWTIRPRSSSDGRLIAATAERMRPAKNQPSASYWR